MTKRFSLKDAVLLVVGMGVIALALQVFNLAIARGKVLSASSVYELSIVTFENGETELIYNDYDYSLDKPEDWQVRTVVAAIPSNDPRYPEFKAPNITLLGASSEKMVYAFDDPYSHECQRNVLYLDRTKMKNEEFTISPTDYCVKSIVDEWDLTTFFAVNPENTKIVLGNVENGAIIASIDATDVTIRPGHNWENTKIAFVTGEMHPEGDYRKLYVWDVTANRLIDKTDVLKTVDSGIGFIHYVRETDSFDLYSDYFDDTLQGGGEFNGYQKLGSFK